MEFHFTPLAIVCQWFFLFIPGIFLINPTYFGTLTKICSPVRFPDRDFFVCFAQAPITATGHQKPLPVTGSGSFYFNYRAL